LDNNMSELYLLKYDSYNLGDDIQTVAVMDIMQDLALDYSLVYRDLINGYFFHPLRKNYIIFNGWFTNGYGFDTYYSVGDSYRGNINVTWPPKGNFTPVLYSFHISEWGENREIHPKFIDEESISFYKSAGRVGCRDLHTLYVMKNMGIDAYFSGCITLSLNRNKYIKTNTSPEVIMVDIPTPYKEELTKKAAAHFSPSGGAGIVHLTHSFSPYNIDITDRFTLARRHIQAFCNAKLVLTNRLHVALPCLAMGTPVIFVCADEDVKNSRIIDYIPFLNVIKYSEVENAVLEDHLKPKYDGNLSRQVRSKFEEIVKAL